MVIRKNLEELIIAIFKQHEPQAVAIDTPVMERTEVLKGNYGDDSKLIYNLADQCGEQLSLRYDLTVPFARYLAENNVPKMTRYHFGRVYRRDSPAEGRYREFYQGDFDIAGDYDIMLPDVECIRIIHEVLTSMELGRFVIKVNHRKLLDGMFEACGVPKDKFRTICSAVDKMDKLPWEKVREEMLEKGLHADVADKIGHYVQQKGHKDFAERLLKDENLVKVEAAKTALDEMKVFLDYCETFGILKDVSFDLSLARGLDYYTGLIFEATLLGDDEDVKGVGSVSGGGRYDELVSMFAQKGVKIPCVGFSIGIERLFSIMEARAKKDPQKVRTVETEVFVISGQKELLTDRMGVCAELWDAKIKAEMAYKAAPKLLTQFQQCEKDGTPFQVIIGEEEKKIGSVKIRHTFSHEEHIVKREVMVDYLKKELKKLQEHH
jgi:histidyl-tRNA synthetase